jgi:ankyrin repeat protein
MDPKIEAAFNHCRLGKYREVETALAEGLPVDSRLGPDDNTMLIQCAINGQKRVAKLLLRNFAEMNAQNNKGDTAMHCCYKYNYKELGEYMKSKGADDTIRNAKGQTCYEAKK